MAPTPLTLALCLYPSVTTADFADPIELLGFISPKYVAKGVLPHPPAFSITVTSLAPSTNPVVPFAGPTLLPDRAYDDVGEGEQFDLILVPGGTSSTRLLSPCIMLVIRRRNKRDRGCTREPHQVSETSGSWREARPVRVYWCRDNGTSGTFDWVARDHEQGRFQTDQGACGLAAFRYQRVETLNRPRLLPTVPSLGCLRRDGWSTGITASGRRQVSQQVSSHTCDSTWLS